MSDDIARLGLYVDDKGVVRANRSLHKLEKQSVKNEKANKRLNKSFVGLKTVVTAVAASMVLKHFISTAAAFETMKVSLETVTGSAEAADRAFDGIREFAANTPFSVEEVTQAFIKLKALGIEPTEANLRSFGNTSSAMGKSLNQMIEAVADAATGEFERLKEFGIKASKQGDQATFVFKGVATTVKNNSQEITKYLRTLGDVEFGGAMAEQMDTVNGAFSNAGDAVDGLANALGEAGLNTVVKTLTLSFAHLANNIADALTGDDTRGIEKQIDDIQERMFNLQEGVDNAADNNFFENLFGGSQETYLKQIAQWEAKLVTLNAQLDEARNKNGGDKETGLDNSGELAKIQEAAAAEIAAEKAKDTTLMETAANFQALHAAQAIQAKQAENEQLAELDKIAFEQKMVLAATAEATALAAAEQAQQDRTNAMSRTLGVMATLTSSSSKRLFKMGKAASIASALINTYQAVTKTMASTPYPFNIPLAAAQGVAGMVQVQNIKGQQMSGQAHDGMDFVKNTGSYQLERGEMVVDKGTSEKVRQGVTGGGSFTFAPVVQAFDANDIMKNKEKLFNGMRNQFVDWMNEEGLRFSQ